MRWVKEKLSNIKRIVKVLQKQSLTLHGIRLSPFIFLFYFKQLEFRVFYYSQRIKRLWESYIRHALYYSRN